MGLADGVHTIVALFGLDQAVSRWTSWGIASELYILMLGVLLLEGNDIRAVTIGRTSFTLTKCYVQPRPVTLARLRSLCAI